MWLPFSIHDTLFIIIHPPLHTLWCDTLHIHRRHTRALARQFGSPFSMFDTLNIYDTSHIIIHSTLLIPYTLMCRPIYTQGICTDSRRDNVAAFFNIWNPKYTPDIYSLHVHVYDTLYAHVYDTLYKPTEHTHTSAREYSSFVQYMTPYIWLYAVPSIYTIKAPYIHY